MGAHENNNLIRSTQDRLQPADRIPVKSVDDTRRYPDDHALIDVPRDWERSGVPDWLTNPGSEVQQISAGATPTIEEDDTESDDLVEEAENTEPTSETFPSFDVWAFYLPFHFYRSSWGVYVLNSGLLKLAKAIAGSPLLTPADRWKLVFAWQALLLHELFHHWVEMAISRAEFPLAQSRVVSDLYTKFFHENRASAAEEPLANANVHRRIRSFYTKSFLSTVSFLSAWHKLNDVMRHQPYPYSQFEKFCKTLDFLNGRNFLVDRAFLPIWRPKPFSSDVISSTVWFGDFETSTTLCPIYFIDDVPKIKVVFSKPFEKLNGIQVFVNTRDHKPPHIHAVDLNTQEVRRFEWPSLVPLKQDVHIRTRTEQAVRVYAEAYRAEISKKVAQVPWQ